MTEHSTVQHQRLIICSVFLPGVNYLERGQQLSQDVKSLFFPPALHSLGDLNSPTRVELGPSEMKVWSPNHWTSREF